MMLKPQTTPKLRFPAFNESWREQRLGKFFTSSRAKGSDGMPTLSVTLNRGLINRDDIDRKTETNLDADEHLLVRAGDIAYNMMRMWQGAFGRSDREGIVSPAYVVLRPLASADSGYFEYAFRRARSIYLFWAYSYGITNDRLRLYANDFLRIPFSAPSVPEQRKIADFLTAVDGRLAQLSQKKALLEAYKKGVMQQLFTQALRFQDDHGNDFPDWEEKTLGDAVTVNPKTSELPESFIYIDLESVNAGVLHSPRRIAKADAPSRAQRLLKRGDILYQTVRPYQMNNYLFDLEGIHVASTGYAQLRASNNNARFIYHSLHFPGFVRRVLDRCTGTGYPAINSTALAEVEIAIPSLPEQTKIANFLTALDRKIEAVAAQIAHTQTWKRGLLQQMFV